MLGLTQFLLVDHEGGLSRRDAFGLLAGLGAVACAGVGVAFVIATGVLTLLRRDWRVAVFQHRAHCGGVLAVVALPRRQRHHLEEPGDPLPMVVARCRRDLPRVGEIPALGWFLGIVLVVGFVVAVRSYPRADRRARAAAPVALLVGAAAFLVLTGATCAVFGIHAAGSSRYVHIVAAMLLPPLAIAANALVEHRRALVPVAAAVFLIAIPANLAATRDSFPKDAFFTQYRTMMGSLPLTPLAAQRPRDLHPDPNQAPSVTIGWLLDGARSGWLPAPGRITPRQRSTNTLRLSLEQLNQSDRRHCAPLGKAVVRTLDVGQSLVVHGVVGVQLVADDAGVPSNVVTFGATFLAGNFDHTLRAVAGPLTLRLARQSVGASAC